MIPLVITPNGLEFPIFKKSWGSLDPMERLKLMQDAVGGYIEPISIMRYGDWSYIVVNEEGVLKDLPLNKKASMIAGMDILGIVVLCNFEDLE